MSRMLEVTMAAEDLAGLSRELQITAMRHWFFENYEDPAERTPFESSEGGYIWIFGGPYDAREELQAEFGDVILDDVIEELVDELNRIILDWAPREKPGDYEDDFLASLAADDDHYQGFVEGVEQIEALLAGGYGEAVEEMYLRMLYAGVVTLLETYLGGTFISAVKNDRNALQRFVESSPDFKKETFRLAEIFSVMETIEARVLRHLADLIWHNLSKVQQMYKACFDIAFPDCARVYAAILTRHDIVHRNGKDKDGLPVDMSREKLETLIRDVRSLVGSIEKDMEDSRPPF
ncbi:hypothetical protein [Cupriavidus basilensis]|uniref:hypothetical protein n=1 Tax=Cupriavidus basilensis TaxID=68895 RepID=UPI0039F6718F